jgi:hypothetical protein
VLQTATHHVRLGARLGGGPMPDDNVIQRQKFWCMRIRLSFQNVNIQANNGVGED